MMTRTLVVSVGTVVCLAGCAGPGTGEGQADEAGAALGEVTVTGGRMSGAPAGDSGVWSFKGIPFAAPPVGDLRWRPPQPVVPWEGALDATAFAPACLQPLREVGSFYGQIVDQMEEDCLYLNVWSAAQPGDAVPVMVWIHGGGLSSGHGGEATYDGTALAERGVVLVTINYRLGPLGYLAHPLLAAESEHQSSGNYGTLDQVASLRWVRDNIAAFGGDPNRVTIFGESAGSWSVNHMQATPLASGLFHRAIGESGGGFGPFATAYATDEMEAMGVQFATALLGPDMPVSPEALRAKSGDEIMALPRDVARFSPNVDGWVFPDTIWNIFADGAQNNVPVIVGSTADEDATLGGGRLAPMTVADYQEYARRTYGELAEAYLATYPAETDEATITARIAAGTDQRFGWEMRTWARMMETVSSDAYFYFFTRVPPGPDSDHNGAFHAGEIIYVFDNLGKSPFPYANQEYTETDHRLSDLMASYWVNFATSGDPNGEGLPAWPTYSRETDETLELGDTVQVIRSVRQDRLDFVDALHAGQRGSSN